MELASHGTNGRHADDRRDTKESKLSDWSALGGGKDAAGASSGHTPSPPPEVAAVAGHFVQRPWHRRFASQFPALLWKNLLVQWRNWRATVLRILAPFSYGASMQPGELSTNYIVRAAQDFFYTPNTSDVVRDQLVARMMRLNPGRSMDASRVLSFSTPEEANAWLRVSGNTERVLGGVHFSPRQPAPPGGAGAFDYLLQVNTSVRYFKDEFYDPNFYYQVPLQVLTENAIAQYYYDTAKAQGQLPADAPDQLAWDISTSMYPHPTTDSINIVGKVIGGFVFAANLFAFALVLSSVVAERERGLRRALKTAGMLESAFWLSWLAVEILAAVLFTLLLIAFGAMFQFEFFLKNSFWIIFFLFFLFQLAMVSFAFLLSTLLAKASTAITLGFVVFLIGWICQSVIVFGFPYTPDYIWDIPVVTVILTLLPWSPLAKACDDLGAATETESSPGISWGNRADYCQNQPDRSLQVYRGAGVYQDWDCVFNITQVLWVLFFEFVVYFLIAVYLDHVLADENGVRKGTPWYFLTPSYWTGRGSGRAGSRNVVRTARGVRSLNPPLPRLAALDAGVERDPDVVAEEARMKDLLQHRTGSSSALSLQQDSSNAVEVYGLQKAFDGGCCGGRGCCGVCCFCCAKRSGRRPGQRGGGEFVAIKGSWYAIERDRVFCLLGPNGAGKTTTINCLTGVLPPSGGDALVYGESLSTPGGMDRIRAVIGVCPQFDVLWGELTGEQHLHLYGSIKGLPKPDVRRQAGELLESVKLTGAAKQRTAAYSGGMRRRLSVALAMLGDPLVLFLDEPTTGMDPISRRHVWDIVGAAKAGRAVVLTTHSMEEADILGDQIAIMARGSVRAIGSSLRLKQRFGSGYQLSVSVLPPRGAGATSDASSAEVQAANAAAVKRMFKEELGLDPADESSKAYLLFHVPKDREEQLPAFLKRLDAARQQLGVSDVQIGLASLEEVFLTIARRAEMEAAAAEGRTTLAWQLEDGSTLEVGMGEEYAEKDGVQYRIRWTQDENGALQILSAVRVGAPQANGSSHIANGSSSHVGGSSSQLAAPQAVEMARKDD
ncbi:hypothetical protein COHA_003963 [Chlorella ohadii]|uniref:ABC transporter domain-containing protein n=1 Tax=Chlorella ohadii TaxID=2649997 RepID=A0AAD5DTX5_9CHLO|nr:hypothetical protein COHA_003963 [Chlorella ohadii]